MLHLIISWQAPLYSWRMHRCSVTTAVLIASFHCLPPRLLLSQSLTCTSQAASLLFTSAAVRGFEMLSPPFDFSLAAPPALVMTPLHSWFLSSACNILLLNGDLVLCKNMDLARFRKSWIFTVVCSRCSAIAIILICVFHTCFPSSMSICPRTGVNSYLWAITVVCWLLMSSSPKVLMKLFAWIILAVAGSAFILLHMVFLWTACA